MRIVGVTGDVDTHADTHVAAAIDHNGGLLGVESFPADQPGYENLLGWLVGFGEVEQIGVEGTGSWGVWLSRFLTDHDVMVVEVDRPYRQKTTQAGEVGSDRCGSGGSSGVVGGGFGNPEGSERFRRTDAGSNGD